MDNLIPLTEHNYKKSETPVLSVFSWAFNHKDFIRESIESILVQRTNFKVEIIIHDDASSDGTKEIIKEYQNKYPFLFNNILQEENQWSQGKSVMTPLIEKPKGKYIALTHGDDYWTDPHKLQKQVDFLEANTDYTLVYHPCMEMKNEMIRKEILNYSKNNYDITVEELLKFNKIHTPSVVFKSSVFPPPDWFINCPVGDYPLWILLGLKGKIRCIVEYMSVYRIHIDSTWSSQNLKYRIIKLLIVLDFISKELNENQNKILSKNFKKNYIRLILECNLKLSSIIDINKKLPVSSVFTKYYCENYIDVFLYSPILIWAFIYKYLILIFNYLKRNFF